MDINEQSYKKEIDGHTLQTYLEKLVDTGKFSISNGQYAIVLVPDHEDYVFKIWTHDPAFDEWVKICLENKANEHLPKFIGRLKSLPNMFIRRRGFDSKIKILKMEKLARLDHNLAKFIDMISEAWGDGAILKEVLASLKKAKAPENVMSFASSVWKIMNQYKTANFGFDLHAGNVMMRGDTIVLIDGFSDIKSMGIRDGKITQSMDSIRFLPSAQALSFPNDELISGRSGLSKSKQTPEYWKTEEAYSVFDFDSFPKSELLRDDIFEYWVDKKASENLIAYAMLLPTMYSANKLSSKQSAESKVIAFIQIIDYYGKWPTKNQPALLPDNVLAYISSHRLSIYVGVQLMTNILNGINGWSIANKIKAKYLGDDNIFAVLREIVSKNENYTMIADLI